MRVDFTASGIILHPTDDKVLLIFHRKLQKWMQTWGHIDPGEVPHETALREAQEETGLECVLHDKRHSQDDITSETVLPLPLMMEKQIIPTYKDQEEHIHCDSFFVLHPLSTETTDWDHNILEVKRFTPDEIAALWDQCFPTLHKLILKIFGN